MYRLALNYPPLTGWACAPFGRECTDSHPVFVVDVNYSSINIDDTIEEAGTRRIATERETSAGQALARPTTKRLGKTTKGLRLEEGVQEKNDLSAENGDSFAPGR